MGNFQHILELIVTFLFLSSFFFKVCFSTLGIFLIKTYLLLNDHLYPAHSFDAEIKVRVPTKS